jgi:hypothetical protein
MAVRSILGHLSLILLNLIGRRSPIDDGTYCGDGVDAVPCQIMMYQSGKCAPFYDPAGTPCDPDGPRGTWRPGYGCDFLNHRCVERSQLEDIIPAEELTRMSCHDADDTAHCKTARYDYATKECVPGYVALGTPCEPNGARRFDLWRTGHVCDSDHKCVEKSLCENCGDNN